MTNTRLIHRIAASLTAGFAMGIAQPDWGFWPLSFVALVPLLWALQGLGVRGRIAIGWCFGTAATMTTPWLPGAIGISNYFDLPSTAGGVAAFSIAQWFGSGSMMLFAALASGDCSDPWRHSLRAAAAWVAAEWIRGVSIYGLPWMLLAYSLQPVPGLAQLASWGGALAVSGTLVLCNAAILHSLTNASRRQGAAIGLLGVSLLLMPMIQPTFFATEGVASVELIDTSVPSESTVAIALIQGMLPIHRRTPINAESARLAQLGALTNQYGSVDLVVWPESAMSTMWPANKTLLAREMRNINSPRLILGVPRSEGARLYNAAVLVGPDAKQLDVHDKVHLLPFAEQAHWPIAPTPGDLTPGDTPKSFELGNTHIGPLICYEILFEDLARSQVASGAGVLINLSNEAWFDSIGAMRQNLAAAVFRSIEVGRPVLRATNSGFTAAIDDHGHVVARLPPNLPGGLAVRVRPSTRTTIYNRIGHWFPIVAATWALTAAVLHPRRRRTSPAPFA